jgi:signal transduction histidine kinase
MNSGNSRPAASGSRPGAEQSAGAMHVVQFCDDDRALTVAAAGFLAEGIASGQPAVAFATAARREGILECLRARGLDVDYLERESRLTIHDARATLTALMLDDMPDPHKFSRTIVPAIERLRAANEGAIIRAFGEMVSLLWEDGNTKAAVRLEELWNELAVVHPIALLCSYAGGEFLTSTGRGGRDEVCRLHTHILDTGGSAETLVDTNLPPYHSLAQRAFALEQELEERKALEVRLREALVARKVAEEELQRASIERERLLHREREARAEAEAANRAKAEFLSVMSHELRTPLNVIGGHVQLIDLELHGPVTDAQHDALSRIARSQQHLLSLVNDVLNLARIETGQVDFLEEHLDVSLVVGEVADTLDPLFRRGELVCEIHLPPADASPVLAAADGERVRQILLNLLTNALKFTPPGGHVHITALESLTTADAVLLVVHDTGPGIDPAKLRHVFEPFGQHEPQSTTRQLDGTGLGLAISRDLARAMGGDLSVASVAGQGSTFTLELRRAGVPTTIAAPTTDASPAGVKHSRIQNTTDGVQPAASS